MGHGSDELIEELSRDLDPVRRIPPLRAVALVLGIVALTVAGLAVALLGLRPDVRALSVSRSYAVITSGLLLFSLGGLLAALGASVPGRQAVSRAGLAAMVLALLLWALAFSWMLAAGPAAAAMPGGWLGLTAYCLGIASAIGLLPAAALLRFVVAAYPYRRGIALGVGAAGMVAFGSLSVHLTCLADEPLHVASAHLAGPPLVGALLGLLLLRLPALRRPHSV